MFNLYGEVQRDFRGYGPLEIPHGLDEQVANVLAGVKEGGQQAIKIATDTSSVAAKRVLRAYAERMASLAVRRNDPDILLNALISNLIGGMTNGEQESLMVMAPIDDAAIRIGLDHSELFEKAATIVGHPGSVSLMLWLARAPENRSLASMAFVADRDADGFRYILNW